MMFGFGSPSTRQNKRTHLEHQEPGIELDGSGRDAHEVPLARQVRRDLGGLQANLLAEALLHLGRVAALHAPQQLDKLSEETCT